MFSQTSSFTLLGLMLWLYLSPLNTKAETIEVALVPGEIKNYAKDVRRRSLRKELSQYIINLEGIDKDSFSSISPCIINHNGAYGMEIIVVEVTKTKHIMDVVHKSIELFRCTNVRNIELKFYRTRSKVEDPHDEGDSYSVSRTVYKDMILSIRVDITQFFKDVTPHKSN